MSGIETNHLLHVEVYLAEHAAGFKGSDAAFVDAVYAVIDELNTLRKAKHVVVLLTDEDGEPTSDVVGPFPSMPEAAKWAMAQPGGEKFWQCSVRKPE